MRKKIAGFMLLLMGVVLLAGCQQSTDSTKEEESYSVIHRNMQIKEEGIFYMDGNTQLMKFYDFQLGQSIPICDRPNCEHNSAECNAYLSQGYMSGMGCYRDKLYYYDNMQEGLPFYQCDKNGANRKVIARLNEKEKYLNLSVNQEAVFFVENAIYFGLEYFTFLDKSVVNEDGTIDEMEYYWMFGKLSLTDGSFEIVKEPEQYDNQKEGIDISDFRNGKLFYTYRKEKEDQQYVYDLKTKEAKNLFQGVGSHSYYLGFQEEQQAEVYLIEGQQSDSIYLLNVQKDEEKLLFEKKVGEGKQQDWSMEGDLLVSSIYTQDDVQREDMKFSAYSFQDGKEKEITKEEVMYGPNYGATKDWYIGFSEDGVFCIKKEDFHKKDWSKVKVIGFF